MGLNYYLTLNIYSSPFQILSKFTSSICEYLRYPRYLRAIYSRYNSFHNLSRNADDTDWADEHRFKLHTVRVLQK